MTYDEGTQPAKPLRLPGEPNWLRLAVTCLDGSRSVGELSEKVGVSQSMVSQHLRLLRAGRLLKETRSGPNVFYELPDCHVRTMLTNMLDHVLEPEDHLHEE